MLKRRHYVTLASVIVLTLVLLNLPNRTASQIKLALAHTFLPLIGLGRSTDQLIQKAGDAIVPKSQVLRQLAEVRRENEQLRLELMQLEEDQHELARLRRMLDMPNPQKWNRKLARVGLRDTANWRRSLVIDLGSRDGVTNNSPVLTPDGLVGRVSEVGHTSSRVVVLGDPACRVAVLVEGETRGKGVIAPGSLTPVDPTLVDLGYLSNSQLKPGQRVYTSGDGGIFPKGILVGRIVDFRSVDFGLFSEARVKLAVNMNELEEAWVILP